MRWRALEGVRSLFFRRRRDATTLLPGDIRSLVQNPHVKRKRRRKHKRPGQPRTRSNRSNQDTYLPACIDGQ
jgi:hypothetical protein